MNPVTFLPELAAPALPDLVAPSHKGRAGDAVGMERAGDAANLRRLSRPGAVALDDFVLPAELEAAEPPEARGLARDEVRLLVSHYGDDRLDHAAFRDLPAYLSAGDLLVINTSGTMNAELPARRDDGTPLLVHLSTRLPAGLWIVEPRRPHEGTSLPLYQAVPGETLALPDGGTMTLHAPYGGDGATPHSTNRAVPYGTESTAVPHDDKPARLWIATLRLPCDLQDYLTRHGTPIRYSYVRRAWPSSYYQTVYATEVGSAEMPSAGRAFTPELLTALVARGVAVAPLILHTGVSSLEDHEPPYEEYYRVPSGTARAVNAARAAGKRVVAVGTTVVRAIESVTDEDGVTHPGEGWTRLVVTPARGLRAVDALLTGLHEPCSSHLAMLEALAGRAHLELTYGEALRERYLWHEFGDLHLLLP